MQSPSEIERVLGYITGDVDPKAKIFKLVLKIQGNTSD
jgi:hypothetical protein